MMSHCRTHPSRPAQRRGKTAYLAGIAAEQSARRRYEQAGYRLLAERWRGGGGEIDLIFEKNGETVFVEVKRAREYAQALARIGPAQQARIALACEEYAARLPQGRLSLMRIDVALVNGTGACHIVKNAFGA
ncbi:YraN family protein [uncultured Lentibacter sp.]|jgi:putative endonuclease|uniref:YraN family protein n=1 Tax=uncultured Lentibacter sp. TaxID=1659309 RepID=UPI00262D1F2E|nr:YraN family protein [uncultured Lentibacter sp.]